MSRNACVQPRARGGSTTTETWQIRKGVRSPRKEWLLRTLGEKKELAREERQGNPRVWPNSYRGGQRTRRCLVLLGEIADRQDEEGRVRREQVCGSDVPRQEGGAETEGATSSLSGGKTCVSSERGLTILRGTNLDIGRVASSELGDTQEKESDGHCRTNSQGLSPLQPGDCRTHGRGRPTRARSTSAATRST